MLGIYISGHPLEKMRHQIESQISVNYLILKEIGMQNSLSESEISSEIAIDSKVISKYKDGQNVKFAGIITSIKKKYTKNNKILTIYITNASDEEKKKLFIRGRFSAFRNASPEAGSPQKAEAKKIKSIHDISLYKFFLQKLQLYNTKMQLKILIQCIQMQLVLSQ